MRRRAVITSTPTARCMKVVVDTESEVGAHGKAAAREAARLIREHRNTRQLSQDALAELVGVPVERIAAWESGSSMPDDPDQRVALDKGLGLDWKESYELTRHILERALDQNDIAVRKAQQVLAAMPKPDGIFIVHGHDTALKDEVYTFLTQVTSERIVILSEQANRGRTVIEKLERHGAIAKFAVVLMTPDDKMADGTRRARPNVVLELGFFIGSIGRQNVCVIRKPPIEDPSDIAGVVYTPVDADGDWKADLLRELRDAGIEVNN
jgi:predicted nucleotide-binding protein/DNA-binding XRE family transcriptional regulator